MKKVCVAGRWVLAAALAVSLSASAVEAEGQAYRSARIYQPPPAAAPACPPATYQRGCPQPQRAPCPDGSYQRVCPPPPRPRHDDNDGLSAGEIAAGGALVLILGTTLFGSGRKSHGSDSPEAETLLKDGPQMPMTYPVGTFSVRGFARNGWPVVLDFEPQPNTYTTLDVVFRKRTVPLVVDTNGLEGRHLVKLQLPGNPKKKTVPATYVLRSVYRDSDGGEPRPAQVEVYGIGGGPRAVGSVAIEQLSMLPEAVAAGTPARFAFSAKSPFNRTRAEVLKFVATSNKKEIQLERVMSTEDDNVSIGPHDGVWDGLDQRNRAASLGVHRFQVRAWFTSDDRSWVGAVAPQLVRVSQ